jgi:hypothetical protein
MAPMSVPERLSAPQLLGSMSARDSVSSAMD